MISAVTIGILAIAAFIVMMVLGVPVPFAMAFGGVLGIMAIRGPQIAGQMLASELFNTFTTYSFTVGPMFGLMGFLASYSGVGTNLYHAINTFIGHKRGGLAVATQVAGAGFGAICGSPAAAVATFSAIAYPEMKKYNYNRYLAANVIGVAAGLSVLIPPSNILIIYGLITETSIGRLFMAGIVPGIMVMALQIITILIIAKFRPDYAPGSPKHTWKERWSSIVHGGLIEIIFVFILSMGGMFAGFFTPTEAGAVGAFGMLISTVATRRLNWKKFISSILSGIRLQAMVFMLLACANILGKLFTVSTIPMVIGNYVKSLDISGTALMVIILIIYVILGMVADLMPMMIVTMPIFFPIVVDYLGYSPLWFGIMLVLLIGIGGMTPPVGAGIFMLKGCIQDKEITIGNLFRTCVPFIVCNFSGVVILLVAPVIVTGLPMALYG
jgi:tripartite ATP-independent transporter DctM subunit